MVFQSPAFGPYNVAEGVVTDFAFETNGLAILTFNDPDPIEENPFQRAFVVPEERRAEVIDYLAGHFRRTFSTLSLSREAWLSHPLPGRPVFQVLESIHYPQTRVESARMSLKQYHQKVLDRDQKLRDEQRLLAI